MAGSPRRRYEPNLKETMALCRMLLRPFEIGTSFSQRKELGECTDCRIEGSLFGSSSTLKKIASSCFPMNLKVAAKVPTPPN